MSAEQFAGPEIYCGPMDDVLVGFITAYGSDKVTMYLERVKAGALIVNSGVPVKCPDPGQFDTMLAMLGDCGALLDTHGLFTENAL